MTQQEFFFEILTIFISAILSGIISLIVAKNEIKRNYKKEMFDNFYNKFHVLRDKIHQGCAYDFVDLSKENQEEIVSLLIETDRYQNKEISDLVYELKTGRLENFGGLDESNIKSCNDCYNMLTELIENGYEKCNKKHKTNKKR